MTTMGASGRYRTQVSGAVRATDFTSATAFTWFGVAGPALSPEVVHAVGPQTTREHLVFCLQQGLYRWFYCEGSATDPRQKPSSSAILRDPLYIARLAASNAGRGYWDPGWHVVSVADDEVVLQKGELRLWASPHDCLPAAAAPMGVQSDPIGEPVKAELVKLTAALHPSGKVAKGAAGYAIDGRLNDAFTAVNMVDDIPNTLKKIEAAGGRVLTPRTDIAPGSGAFAVFADPAGTEFGLYEEPRR